MMLASPLATSLSVLEMVRAGRFAEICDLFAPQLRTMVAPEMLQGAWEGELRRQGRVTSVGQPVTEPSHAGVVVVKIPLHYERGELTLVVSVTEAGHLAGLQLAPAGAAQPILPWEPPDYADPAQFDEREVAVGSGPLAVPGTLTLPAQTGPWPGVVMLAGSGPQDRDETIGRNKPLKDLAWGLASRGVVVLRFDKVTYAHPAEAQAARDFTLADEYVPHATAAIQLLQRHSAVDAQRIFLLGHSQGGTVAPRVAAAEPLVAGLIIMAGGTQPLHWSAVRQVRYLASLAADTASASRPTIEAMSEQARRVDSPDLLPSTPASELPFGVPATYWLDLRTYEPVAVAAALGKPMLILQGGRDYQTTVAEDLTQWQAGLAHRSEVTIRVYDADNHFFLCGSGLSTPAEYEPAQHVDPAVVGDIASWLTTVAGGSSPGQRSGG